jgi:type II secretory pathway component PulF
MAQAATTGIVKSIKRDTPFTWEGRDKKGNKVKGKSVAADEAALRADLRRQGIAASRIRKQSSALKAGGKVKPQDIAVFMRQLATMLAAGIPLVQGLEIVGGGMTNRRHRSSFWASRPTSRRVRRCTRPWPNIPCTSTS